MSVLDVSKCKNSYMTSILDNKKSFDDRNLKTLLTFSITFLLTLVGLTTETSRLNHFLISFLNEILTKTVKVQFLFFLILVKLLKKLCIITSIDIWNILRYSIHFCLTFEKNLQPCNALFSISITESIRQSVDNEFACGIFIDLKKAFDTVNHAIQLTNLNHYGIRGNVHEWFKSYLSHREQFVIVSSHDSIPYHFKLSVTVAQGSILGPLLLLL